ncbi:hypothetical protein SAMN05216571_1075 [Onishia taeanensis]|uniref:Uncharacterized protein n=1 Tax=Onishia taeanensis TaxID=284577 RepID=A0A1G7SLA4_9GAMM|nr:hypothetical protein [Halomonas taeanensis]SDG23731.1 hypothetical protein SAMN05216571_1075 [Halomonas taeanensis]
MSEVEKEKKNEELSGGIYDLYVACLKKNNAMASYLKGIPVDGGSLYEVFNFTLKLCEHHIKTNDFSDAKFSYINNGGIERLRGRIKSLVKPEAARNGDDKIGDLAGEIWGLLDWLEANSWGEKKYEVSEAKINLLNSINASSNNRLRESFQKKLIDRLTQDKKFESIVEITSIVNDKVHSSLEAMRHSLDKDIEGANTKAGEILEKLEIAEKSASFTYLYAGFDSLRNNLSTSLEESNGKLNNFKKAIVLLPVAVFILAVVALYSSPETFTWQNKLSVGAPIASIEFVLIYFFRIELSRAKSLEEMLWQADNESAAIAYYAAYSKTENIESSSDIFKKFNDFVFSPVRGSDWNPPTVTDGLSDLSKMFGK